MFGINDSNQDQTNQPPAAGTDSQAPMPPSPFMDSSGSGSGSDSGASAPALPDNLPAPSGIAKSGTNPPMPAGDNNLVTIKEQALNNLAPLVNHLEQTPEEKFKTTMMLIQASDNSSLVKDAYEAAQQITDEKARAQALLDVVNEINYFTQKEKQT